MTEEKEKKAAPAESKPRLTPEQIVVELDKYIVGQHAAKRAVAVALRNRDRRRDLPKEVRRDILPKNILMIGPTGVGKTEIARRVAELVGAPFVKVEATRFTEVGYVGRDVESIARELLDNAVDVVHRERATALTKKAEHLAQERLVDYLCQQYPSGRVSLQTFHPRVSGPPQPTARSGAAPSTGRLAAAALAESEQSTQAQATVAAPVPSAAEKERLQRRRRRMARLLESKRLEDALVEVEVPDEGEGLDPILEFSSNMSVDEMSDQFQDFVSKYQSQSRARLRRLSVREARGVLTEEETEKLIDHDAVIDDAVERVEEMGVVFIDELDKIAGPAVETGPDVSGEGVQRDLLPIVEGTTVGTRFGPVRTDHILFIAAGSFYKAKPSDLIPELQGRFPLRVELSALSRQDFVRILKEPQNALTRQYEALLGTEGVTLQFSDDALEEIARYAWLMNERVENIGARRLATIAERVLEELSFEADRHRGETIVIDGEMVRRRLEGVIADEDLSRYIL